MFRKISDFAHAWQNESSGTLKMFKELTDASLNERITPDTRSAGSLAWHIVCSIGEMMTTAGLPLGHLVTEKDPVPEQAAGIVQAYEAAAAAVAKAVEAGWTDDQLGDDVPMYGEQWKKGFILFILIEHETHHRGQLTMVMRKAGLKVPGVVGPSREEWAAYGMAAPN